uniref:Caspase family p20 domain-containing protein n=1 Tax=Graphocephala atropunctata TaxID=36148 RepID=A0A1B6KQU7_9HEMI
MTGEDEVVERPLTESDAHYAMDHGRRGVAAIFNQEHFLQSGVHDRKGSQQDCHSLVRSFSRLGFDVETFLDLELAEIEHTLETLSQRDHSDCDCFVLAFMSHGLEGKLRSKDDVFDVNLLWERFTAENCPTLANKPKIFFIQACQGHGRQKAVLVPGAAFQPQDSVQDPVKLVPSYLLPDRADFLVALSTIPGFVSWRSPEKGSWYIQTLCRHLDSHGFHKDILTLLTDVGRSVSLDFTYYEDSAPRVSSCRKQLPSVISLLIRSLRFTKKGPTRGKRSGSRSGSRITLKRSFDSSEIIPETSAAKVAKRESD